MNQFVNKNSNAITVVFLVITGVLFSRFFFWHKKFNIEGLREYTQHEMDSTMRNINRINKYYYHIDSLINSQEPFQAMPLVDSMINLYPNDNYFWLHYKALIFYKASNYDSALYFYNICIADYPTVECLSGRGNVYRKLGKLRNALSDFKDAYYLNYDYASTVGDIFNVMAEKDSALFYYNVYLEHYPSDTLILKKRYLLYNIK